MFLSSTSPLSFSGGTLEEGVCVFHIGFIVEHVFDALHLGAHFNERLGDSHQLVNGSQERGSKALKGQEHTDGKGPIQDQIHSEHGE